MTTSPHRRNRRLLLRFLILPCLFLVVFPLPDVEDPGPRRTSAVQHGREAVPEVGTYRQLQGPRPDVSSRASRDETPSAPSTATMI